MQRLALLFILFTCLLYSCRPTKNIQAAIAKIDTVAVPETNISTKAREDSFVFIRDAYTRVLANRISFTTFSGKLDVDYGDADGKKYDVNAHLRMYADSVIWISITAILGIEGLRVLVTRDSVKLLDKQNKIYTARSVAYLQELTALPLDLSTLQDLLIGNPVFLDPNLLSYSKSENGVTLQSLGEWFKALISFSTKDFSVSNSKLDDVDPLRNRTCYLTYTDYDNKRDDTGNRFNFSSKRTISVSEKKNLDIKLEFKQSEFNEKLSFPFSIPKNYDRN